jgi:vanillate O-demethylase ferredoxin subunit
MAMTLSARIAAIRDEAIGIKSFELVVPGLAELPDWTPGAHIDTYLGPDTVRQYSLCGERRARDRYLIAVKREPASRGGSIAWHARRPGEAITIGMPRNNFALAERASLHVLVAGGIGITPLLSMARHLHATGAAYELHYFARSAQHAAFHAVLAELPPVHFHLGVEPAAMRPYVERVLPARAGDAHLYLCGPRPFMDLVQAHAACAWPSGSVHVEHFTAPAQPPDGAERAFRIRIASTGQELAVPADRTVVDVLAAHGIAIETSCRQGVCGTCITGVLEGVPDHRDEVLGDAARREGKLFTPTVSLSLSHIQVLAV